MEEQIQRLSLVSPHAEGNHRSNTESSLDIRLYFGVCVDAECFKTLFGCVFCIMIFLSYDFIAMAVSWFVPSAYRVKSFVSCNKLNVT